MSVNVMNPYYSGGYTTPRHVFIADPVTRDLSDGHVAHPSGDPRYGLVNGQPLHTTAMLPAVSIANGGKT